MGKALTIEKIKESVAKVAKKYPVEKVTLFGSYARGTQRPKSDIDMLVSFARSTTTPVTLFTIIDFERELSDITGKRVEIVTTPIPTDSLLIIDKEIPLYG